MFRGVSLQVFWRHKIGCVRNRSKCNWLLTENRSRWSVCSYDSPANFVFIQTDSLRSEPYKEKREESVATALKPHWLSRVCVGPYLNIYNLNKNNMKWWDVPVRLRVKGTEGFNFYNALLLQLVVLVIKNSFELPSSKYFRYLQKHFWRKNYDIYVCVCVCVCVCVYIYTYTYIFIIFFFKYYMHLPHR